jgi:hypothetical protein
MFEDRNKLNLPIRLTGFKLFREPQHRPDPMKWSLKPLMQERRA